MRKNKYIFIVGGVMSGVGKGVTTSSIGKILQGKGFSVSPIKIDPYLNVDAGTMNPTEHGEVFVLNSGLECDQDMGNYERFLDMILPPENYMTTGMVYKSVIERERNLGYGGRCVEAVPHIPEEVLSRIEKSVRKTKADISLVEIGGTIGEYQNILFIEAARNLKLRRPKDVIFVMVSYLPLPHKVGEMKTKPTQHAIRTLNSYGVQPDIIVARSEKPLDKKRKEKIALSCNIPVGQIISAPDIDSIYKVPINFEKDGLGKIILNLFDLKSKKKDLRDWKKMVTRGGNAKESVSIAIVGKYFKTGNFILSDVYISIIEALKHACCALNRKPNLVWIDSEKFEKNPKAIRELDDYDGVLVPGGFGKRGIEGIIKVVSYCRKNKIPYFGICYGMHLAIIEYARSVLHLAGANSKEINSKTRYPIIDIMSDQKENIEDKNMGGTMRLGGYKAKLSEGTIVREAYGASTISERHRHRYEVNPKYIKKLEDKKMIFSGKSPDGRLMEIMELPKGIHPFFVGVQFHPEFQSSPLSPHPLFLEFIKISSK